MHRYKKKQLVWVALGMTAGVVLVILCVLLFREKVKISCSAINLNISVNHRVKAECIETLLKKMEFSMGGDKNALFDKLVESFRELSHDKKRIVKIRTETGTTMLETNDSPRTIVLWFQIKNRGWRDVRRVHMKLQLSEPVVIYTNQLYTPNNVLSKGVDGVNLFTDLEAIAPNTSANWLIWYRPAYPHEHKMRQVYVTYEDGAISSAFPEEGDAFIHN